MQGDVTGAFIETHRDIVPVSHIARQRPLPPCLDMHLRVSRASVRCIETFTDAMEVRLRQPRSRVHTILVRVGRHYPCNVPTLFVRSLGIGSVSRWMLSPSALRARSAAIFTHTIVHVVFPSTIRDLATSTRTAGFKRRRVRSCSRSPEGRESASK